MSPTIRKRHHPTIYSNIVDATTFLPLTTKIRERIFVVLNDITSRPTCQQCNSFVKFLGPASGYRRFCSCKCAGKSEVVLEKRVETNIRKYGAPTPAQSIHGKTQHQSTLESRYGVGVTSTQQLSHVREKSIATFTEQYGSQRNFLRRNINPEVIQLLDDREYMVDQHVTSRLPVSQIALNLNTSSGVIERSLNDHGIIRQFYQHSCGEAELVEQIRQHYPGEISTSVRGLIRPYELDIVFKLKNLAIEYNGMYWHSESAGRNRRYHLTKYEMCQSIGIRLIQVWESEWKMNPTLVLSRIFNALAITPRKLHARKCSVREISASLAKDFLAQHHTQGGVNASINVGLFSDDQLVAVMNCGRSRYDDSQYELLRLASTTNTNVVGGASKLFKWFIKQYTPSSVTSYCDLRWGDGKMYHALGFKLVGRTQPNYRYFSQSNPYVTMSRVKFQKQKLARLLKHFDPTLSEWENMKANGYNRIWDCGNLKFVYVG